MIRYANEWLLVFLIQLVGRHVNSDVAQMPFPLYFGLNIVLLFWRGRHNIFAITAGSITYHGLQHGFVLDYALWPVLIESLACLALHDAYIKHRGPQPPIHLRYDFMVFLVLLMTVLVANHVYCAWLYSATLTEHSGYLLNLINGSFISAMAFFIWGAYPIYTWPLSGSFRRAWPFAVLTLLMIYRVMPFYVVTGLQLTTLGIGMTLLGIAQRHGRYGLGIATLWLAMFFNCAQLVSSSAIYQGISEPLLLTSLLSVSFWLALSPAKYIET